MSKPVWSLFSLSSDFLSGPQAGPSYSPSLFPITVSAHFPSTFYFFPIPLAKTRTDYTCWTSLFEHEYICIAIEDRRDLEFI